MALQQARGALVSFDAPRCFAETQVPLRSESARALSERLERSA
jgi:hypothetical protein